MDFQEITQWQRAPSCEVNTFTHIKGLIYKQVMDSNQRFLAASHSHSPGILQYSLNSHDKLGLQGINRTYHLVKHQYYWKGMNKDI